MHLKWFLTHSYRAAGRWIHLLFCFAVLFIVFTHLRIHWAVWLLWRHFVRSKRDETHPHMLLDKSVPPYTFTKKHLSPRFIQLFIWIITVMFAVKLPWNCSNVFHHCSFAPYASSMPPLKRVFTHLFASHYLQKKQKKNKTQVCEKVVYSFAGSFVKSEKTLHVCRKCLAKHLLDIQPADPPLPEPRWKLKTPLSFIKGREAFCVFEDWQVNRIKSKNATCKCLKPNNSIQLAQCNPRLWNLQDARLIWKDIIVASLLAELLMAELKTSEVGARARPCFVSNQFGISGLLRGSRWWQNFHFRVNLSFK